MSDHAATHIGDKATPVPQRRSAKRQATQGYDELDPTNAFVRTAVKYYDERWRWMDWSGKPTRWNWAAALGGPIWFAYRRMKPIAALYCAWIVFAVFANGLGFALMPLLTIQICIMLLAGLYGTFLYGQRFRQELRRAYRQTSDETERAQILSEHGGSSYRAAISAMIGLPIIAILTFYAAGSVVASVEDNAPKVFALPPEG